MHFSFLNVIALTITYISYQIVFSSHSRYVREWLGAMSAANVITVQGNKDLGDCFRYFLSEEYYDIVESCAIFGKGVFACHNRMGILKTCFDKDGPQGKEKTLFICTCICYSLSLDSA